MQKEVEGKIFNFNLIAYFKNNLGICTETYGGFYSE